MIEAHELTKRYGDTTAVHTLSFTIAPGTVTGFLGPNSAGKSTTGDGQVDVGAERGVLNDVGDHPALAGPARAVASCAAGVLASDRVCTRRQ